MGLGHNRRRPLAQRVAPGPPQLGQPHAQLFFIPPGVEPTIELFWDRLHPDDREPTRLAVEAALRDRTLYAIDHRAINPKTGEVRWIRSAGQGIYVGDGHATRFDGINYDITERKQAEEERLRLLDVVAQEKDQLSALVNSITDEIWFVDTEGGVTLTNPSVAREFGLSLPDATDVKQLAESLEVLRQDRNPRPVEEAPPLRALRGEVVRNLEETVRTPATGELRHRQVSSSPVRDAKGNIIGSVSVVRDITEQKRREERIAKLTRLYAVLSRANEAIVRARDAEALRSEVCRIVAEIGEFPLAWIGELRGRQIVPVACAGPAADYLEGIQIEIDGPLGAGPGGTCIREDRTVVNEDFSVNPRTAPWRAAALRFGILASAAFPLRCGGKPVAELTLYVREAGAFDAEQVALLESLQRGPLLRTGCV